MNVDICAFDHHALGAPVVAYGCGGFQDSVQDGVTGSLITIDPNITYSNLYNDPRIAAQLTEALAERLEWALRDGNLPHPDEVRKATWQTNSYEAVGNQLLSLLNNLPR